MEVKVANKIVDLSKMDDKQKQSLFKEWHKKDGLSTNVECLCDKTKNVHPRMSVRKIRNHYYIANLPSSHIEHETYCFYDKKYREGVKKKGITIKDDGSIEVSKLDTSKIHTNSGSGKKNPISRNHSYYEDDPLCTCRLSSLFLTMLQKCDWHQYKPHGQRNLSKRLYRTGHETTVQGVMLNYKNLLVAKSKKQFVSEQHFVVGWGNIHDEVLPSNLDFKIKLPLYSIEDSCELITYIEVERNVYEEAKIVAEKIRNNVEQGFWIIWREPHKTQRGKRVMATRYISFIPSEQKTKIPVESSHEKDIVDYLVEEKRHFKKPLIGDIKEEHGIKIRPDIILYDTPKVTMVEVAGVNTEKYLSHLGKKKEIYLQENYLYLEWLAMNGEPLPPLPSKQ